MNIFWLDEDHDTAAEYYCDKHLVKINVEINQLISTALRDNGYEWNFLYKPTHGNHPLSKWVGETDYNFIETVKHAHALGREFTYRFGGTHTSHEKIAKRIGGLHFEFGGTEVTERPQAMPEEYKVEGDYVTAYRNYYILGKDWEMKWTDRGMPEWYKNAMEVA